MATAKLTHSVVIKTYVTGDGVWSIRRGPKGARTIEVVKVEPTGTGNILSEEFIEWRKELQAKEVAKMLGAIE
jgi:RAT1-interacting protein